MNSDDEINLFLKILFGVLKGLEEDLADDTYICMYISMYYELYDIHLQNVPCVVLQTLKKEIANLHTTGN